MARDLITPVSLTRESGTDIKNSTVATTITVANGAYIDVTDVDCAKLIIHVKNTYAGAKNVTVNAGVYARAGLGSLVVSVAASTGEKGIVVESSRFKDASGYITIDFESGMVGTIAAYLLP